jgi:hypothetical protein
MTARFPLPWSVEETDACFIVRDGNGQALAYVYFEEEPGRRSAVHLLTHDEERRIAVNVAELPGFYESVKATTDQFESRRIQHAPMHDFSKTTLWEKGPGPTTAGTLSPNANSDEQA